MSDQKITCALISVSDKSGLVEFARFLADNGVAILSTGGSAKMLRDADIAVTEVSDHTGFPEIMDGRVKTLHPTIHGGLLGRRDDEQHKLAMSVHDITPIDLLVVNLYPFEETVARGGDFDDLHREYRYRRPGADSRRVEEPRIRHRRHRHRGLPGGDGRDDERTRAPPRWSFAASWPPRPMPVPAPTTPRSPAGSRANWARTCPTRWPWAAS